MHGATRGSGSDPLDVFGQRRLQADLAGDAIPAPSSLEAVMGDPDSAGAVAVLVPAPEVRGKAVPVTLTMDEVLLDAIDKAAGPRGRSRFFDTAAREKLART